MPEILTKQKRGLGTFKYGTENYKTKPSLKMNTKSNDMKLFNSYLIGEPEINSKSNDIRTRTDREVLNILSLPYP